MTQSVLELLFGAGVNKERTKAHYILSSSENYVEQWTKLFRLCEEDTKDYQVIADIVAATTASSPPRANGWLSIIASPFHVNEELPEQFVKGAALGLFKSINWLDEYWQQITKFEDLLIEVMPSLVFYSTTTFVIDEQSEFTNELSKAIKAYPRGAINYRGKRIHDSNLLLDKLHTRATELQLKDEDISPLGNLIIEQLSYSMFGAMSTTGRLRAMAEFNRNLLPLPV